MFIHKKFPKIFFFIILLLLPIFSTTTKAIVENQTIESSSNISNRVIVKFKEGKNLSHADEFANINSIKEIKNIKNDKFSILTLINTNEIQNTIENLQKNENIEYVQPDYFYETAVINTNDTFKAQLWGLDNTGQKINGIAGTNDADIDAPEAWEVFGSNKSEVIVAVIDSGVDYSHEDLSGKMWDGKMCKDWNGTVIGDCKGGYDFEDNDKNPFPDITDTKNNNHGTHVAGIVGATSNNNKGVIGVAPNARIMALKSSLFTSEIIQAIDFAEENGARVINASWGGTSHDEALEEAIAGFDGLFVVAAHNFSKNVETTPYYPCAYTLSNIICVGSTDNKDNLSPFSNYGTSSVDIAAPGSVILSTVAFTSDPNKYQYFSGTSMATPYVSGAVAMIWGYKPNITKEEVRSLLLDNADIKASLNGKINGNRRLNLYNILRKMRERTALYRFWSQNYQGHFYTANSIEKDTVINTDPNWEYEGIGYFVSEYTNSCIKPDLSPVYRFWNPKAKHHFYTINEAEKDHIIANDPNWTYEGLAFCASKFGNNELMPVYRFYSKTKNAHFYTINEIEKNLVIANDPSWTYEGIGYYAYMN